MNYYDEISASIEASIAEERYDDALLTIRNELSIAYVPSDFEEKLHGYLDISVELYVLTDNTKTLLDT